MYYALLYPQLKNVETCHLSVVRTHIFPGQTKLTITTRANNSLILDSHIRDQVMHFKTAENLCAGWHFYVRKYNKTFNDWPKGISQYCSPLDPKCSPRIRHDEHRGSRGKKTHCFSSSQSFRCYYAEIPIFPPKAVSTRRKMLFTTILAGLLTAGIGNWREQTWSALPYPLGALPPFSQNLIWYPWAIDDCQWLTTSRTWNPYGI